MYIVDNIYVISGIGTDVSNICKNNWVVVDMFTAWPIVKKKCFLYIFI